MIRINLIPSKPVKKKGRGEIEILILLLALVLEGIVIFLLFSNVSNKVERQERDNQLKSRKIAALKEEIKDHEQIKAELEEIDEREKIIQELIAGRTGPVQMLLELSQILSQGGGPSVDEELYKELLKQSPTAKYEPSWDSRRLWIDQFTEENREVDLQGHAMSNEDVGEFLRRLKLSDYFYDEKLIKTAEKKNKESNVSIVSWHIKCKIRYR